METPLEKNLTVSIKSSTHDQDTIDNDLKNISENEDILKCALEEDSSRALSDDGSLSLILGLQMKKFIQTRSHSQVYGKVEKQPSSYNLINETHSKKYTTANGRDSESCMLYRKSTDLDSSCSEDLDRTSASKTDSLLIEKGSNFEAKIKNYQYVKDPKPSSLSHSNKVFQTNDSFQKQKTYNGWLINNNDDNLSLSARHSTSNRLNEEDNEDSTNRSTHVKNKIHAKVVDQSAKVNVLNEPFNGAVSKDQCLLVEKESFFLMILLIDSVAIVEKSLQDVPFHFHLSWIADSKSVSSPTYFFDGSVSENIENAHSSKKLTLTSSLTSLDWCTYLETQLDLSSVQQTISPLHLHKTAAKEALFRGKIVLNLTHEKSNETLAVAAFNVNDLGASDVFRKLIVELRTTAGVFAIITLYVACQKRWIKVHPSGLECEPSSFQNNASPFYNVDQDDQAHFLHQFVNQEVIQSRDWNGSDTCQSDHSDPIETDLIANAQLKMDMNKAPVERKVQLSPTSSSFSKTHDIDHIPSHSSNDSYFRDNRHEEPAVTRSVSSQDSLKIYDKPDFVQSQDASVEISNTIKHPSVFNENFYEKRPSFCKASLNTEAIHTKTTREEKKNETEERPCVQESFKQNAEWTHRKPDFEMSTEKSKTGLRELFHVCQQLTEIPDNTTSVLEEERTLSSDNSPHVLLRKAIHLCIGLCQQVTQSSNNKEATEAKEYLETLRNLANRIGKSLEESVFSETSQCYNNSNKREKFCSSNSIRTTKGFPIDNVSNLDKLGYISHTNDDEVHTDRSFYVDSQETKNVVIETQVNGNSEALSTLHESKPSDKNYLCLGYSSNAMVWKRSLLNHKEDVSPSHGLERSANRSIPKMVGKPQKYKGLFPESRTDTSQEEDSENDLHSNSSSHPMPSNHALEKPELTRLKNGMDFLKKKNPTESYSNNNKKQENEFQNPMNSLHETASCRKASFGHENNQKMAYMMKNRLLNVEQDSERDAEVCGPICPHSEEKQTSKGNANRNFEMEWHMLATNSNEKSRILKRERQLSNENTPKASNYTHKEKIITPPTFLMRRNVLSRPNGSEKHSNNDYVRSRSMERNGSHTSAMDTRLYSWRNDHPEVSHDKADTYFFSKKLSFKTKENLGLLEPNYDESKRMAYEMFGPKKDAENKVLLRDAPQETGVFKQQSTSAESSHVALSEERDRINERKPYRQQPVNVYDKVAERFQSPNDIWELQRSSLSNSSMNDETAESKKQMKVVESKNSVVQRLTSTHSSRVEQIKKKTFYDQEEYQSIGSNPSADHNFLSNKKEVKKSTASNTPHRNKNLFGGTRVGVIKERLGHVRRLEKIQSTDEFIQPSTLLHNGSNAEHTTRRQSHYPQDEYIYKKSFVKEEYTRQAEYRGASSEDHPFSYQLHCINGAKPNVKNESTRPDVNRRQSMAASLNDNLPSSCHSSECVVKSPHRNELNSYQQFGDSSASEKRISRIHTTEKNSVAHRTSSNVSASKQPGSKCFTAVPSLDLHRQNEGHLVNVQLGFVAPPLPAKPLPTRRHHGSFTCSTFPLQCGNTRPPLLGGALANDSTH